MLKEPEIKYIICDIPNTLFDSRHRTTENICCVTGIENDRLNYGCYQLVKTFKDAGYRIIFTHYILSRLAYKVKKKMKDYSITDYSKICFNFNTQAVYNNQTLKQHLYEQILSEDYVEYVIDNDPEMKPYWLSKETSLIQVPLGMY